MAVQESTVINASVEQVIEAFSSEDFARFVCSEVGVEFGSFSVSGDTSAEFTATTERTVPAERVPDIARKFVGSGVSMTQVDTVSAPAADGARTVSTEVKTVSGASGVPSWRPPVASSSSFRVMGSMGLPPLLFRGRRHTPRRRRDSSMIRWHSSV